MALNFNEMKSKAQQALGKNSDKVDKGLDKASKFAKSRFQGKSDQIDNAVSKARTFVHKQADESGGSPGSQPPGSQPPGSQPPGSQPPGNQPPGNQRPTGEAPRWDEPPR